MGGNEKLKSDLHQPDYKVRLIIPYGEDALDYSNPFLVGEYIGQFSLDLDPESKVFRWWLEGIHSLLLETA